MAGQRKRYSAEFKAGVGRYCIDPAMGGVSGIDAQAFHDTVAGG